MSEKEVPLHTDSLHKLNQCLELTERLSRRLSQHTDLRLENIWGEFCATIEWTQNKIKQQSQNSKNKILLMENLCNEFLEILKEPSAKETPAALLASELLNQFLKTNIKD